MSDYIVKQKKIKQLLWHQAKKETPTDKNGRKIAERQIEKTDVIQKEIQGMIGISSSFVLRNILKRKLEMYSEYASCVVQGN